MTRMFRYIKSFGLVVVSVGLVLAILLGSVVPVKAAEPEERVVKIAFHAAFTGPLATVGVPLGSSTVDSIRYRNAHGGINGVEVECLWEETRMEVPRCITAHKRFREAGVVAELIFEATPTETLTPRMQRDEIPLLYFTGATPEMVTEPIAWVFTADSGVVSLTTALLEWLKEQWTEERIPRIGMIFFDTGIAWDMRDAVKRCAPDYGAEFVGYEVVPLLGTLDTSTEWLRLAAKRPDWVIYVVTGSSGVTTMKDAARLDIQGKGIKLYATAYALDEAIIRATGEEAAEGWYVFGWFLYNNNVDMSLPAMRPMIEAVKQYRGWGQEKISGYYTAGWIMTLVAMEGIRLAIEKVGYADLTGRAVRDGLVRINDFETGLVPPITMTEERPFFMNYIRMYLVQQGKIVPITDWRELTYFEVGASS